MTFLASEVPNIFPPDFASINAQRIVKMVRYSRLIVHFIDF